MNGASSGLASNTNFLMCSNPRRPRHLNDVLLLHLQPFLLGNFDSFHAALGLATGMPPTTRPRFELVHLSHFLEDSCWIHPFARSPMNQCPRNTSRQDWPRSLVKQRVLTR